MSRPASKTIRSGFAGTENVSSVRSPFTSYGFTRRFPPASIATLPRNWYGAPDCVTTSDTFHSSPSFAVVASTFGSGKPFASIHGARNAATSRPADFERAATSSSAVTSRLAFAVKAASIAFRNVSFPRRSRSWWSAYVPLIRGIW